MPLATVFYTKQNTRPDGKVDFPVPETPLTTVFYTKQNTRLDGKVDFQYQQRLLQQYCTPEYETWW